MQVPQAEASRRDPERGVVLVLVLVALVTLLSIGGITMLSVKNEITSAGSSRFQDTALYAAESGISAGVDYLRSRCGFGPATLYSNFVSPNNGVESCPAAIYGNNLDAVNVGNPFTPLYTDNRAWYRVCIRNNPLDPGFAAGDDDDGIITLRSVGRGPNGSQSVIEVDIRPVWGAIPLVCPGLGFPSVPDPLGSQGPIGINTCVWPSNGSPSSSCSNNCCQNQCTSGPGAPYAIWCEELLLGACSGGGIPAACVGGAGVVTFVEVGWRHM